MPSVHYRREFGRLHRARELLMGGAQRIRPPNFQCDRPMAAIIGDQISDSVRARGLYERDYLELVRDVVLAGEECKQQVAIDVGANIGNHALFFSDIFARVIAFEPNPLARELLRLNVSLNEVSNVEIRSEGLSDHSTTASLTFQPSNLGAARLSKASVDGSGPRRQVPIELATGDEIVDHSEPVGFIKVDVEGVEEAVLRGLRHTIQTHMPVIMLEQLSDVINAEAGDSPAAHFLRNLGYEAWEIRAAGPFKGKTGKLLSAILGRADYVLDPVHRMRKRDYPALIFTPPSYVFPQPS